jgi:hypothetical protein
MSPSTAKAKVPQALKLTAALAATSGALHQTLLAVAGSVTDLRTTVAMTPAQAKQAFTKAGELAGTFKSAGQAR